MPVTLTIDPAGPSKGSIMDLMFLNMGINDPDPDERIAALKFLDAMMLEHPWNRLGYEQPTYGAGLTTDGSGIASDSLAAVASNLAVRFAPAKGKTLSAEQRKSAADSFQYISAQHATIPTAARIPATPRGSGSRSTWRTFLTPEA
jgi:hypothetical protein